MKTKQAVENKNYLPNGGFRFSQKYVNTSVAIPTNYTSFVGMDFGRCARGGTYTSPLFNRVDYSEDTEYENGFVKKRYTGVLQGLPTDSSYSLQYQHRVPSILAKNVSNRRMYYSLYHATYNCTTLNITVYKANAKDDLSDITSFFSQDITIAGDGTWAREEVAIDFPDVSDGYIVRVLATNGSTSTTNYFYFSTCMLNPTPNARFVEYDSYEKEYDLCQLFYQKSCDLDVAPASVTTSGNTMYWATVTTSAGSIMTSISFPKRMYKAPTPLVYNPGTGASGYFLSSAGTSVLGYYAYISAGGFTLAGALTAGQYCRFVWEADGTI